MKQSILVFFLGVVSIIWSEASAEEVPYLATFYQAEIQYDLPANLLVEVARQESNFREDIISCKTVSSAGAKGIMQIVPRYHPGVNPCHPQEAIMYGARYLRQLHNQTHSWVKALASYYWGPANVQRSSSLPPMVQKYVFAILDRTFSSHPPSGVMEKASLRTVSSSKMPFGTSTLDEVQSICYALGTIGYDSVVNRENGVPLDQSLDLADIIGELSPVVTTVVTQAYEWKATPHEYSMHVYAWCTNMLKDTVRM